MLELDDTDNFFCSFSQPSGLMSSMHFVTDTVKFNMIFPLISKRKEKPPVDVNLYYINTRCMHMCIILLRIFLELLTMLMLLQMDAHSCMLAFVKIVIA